MRFPDQGDRDRFVDPDDPPDVEGSGSADEDARREGDRGRAEVVSDVRWRDVGKEGCEQSWSRLRAGPGGCRPCTDSTERSSTLCREASQQLVHCRTNREHLEGHWYASGTGTDE